MQSLYAYNMTLFNHIYVYYMLIYIDDCIYLIRVFVGSKMFEFLFSRIFFLLFHSMKFLCFVFFSSLELCCLCRKILVSTCSKLYLRSRDLLILVISSMFQTKIDKRFFFFKCVNIYFNFHCENTEAIIVAPQ